MAFAPTTALEYLRRAYDSDRLGHAYLLVGEQVAMDVAWQLAGMVVRVPSEAVAGHPDVHVIEPESKSRRIVIEQMRELENSLRLRAATAGGRKVGIIREADRLQVQASNAFLKTLEEPPAASLLLLVTAQPEALMETILSRCIKVVLQAPGQAHKRPQTPEGTALLDLLADPERERGDAHGGASVPIAYRLLREFTGLLAAVRSRLQGAADKALETEKGRYAQTTDGSWLADRETYYKSLTEARYTSERAGLVEILSQWWGDTLRRQVENAPDGEASQPSTVQVLQRLAVLDELRENLDRNIQEALALEVAFLQVFGS